MNILKGNDEKKEIQADELTLENLETALANDTKVKLAGLDVDGLLRFPMLQFMTDTRRYPTRQARVQEEVPVRRERWLWLLQRCLWLGYA